MLTSRKGRIMARCQFRGFVRVIFIKTGAYASLYPRFLAFADQSLHDDIFHRHLLTYVLNRIMVIREMQYLLGGQGSCISQILV